MIHALLALPFQGSKPCRMKTGNHRQMNPTCFGRFERLMSTIEIIEMGGSSYVIKTIQPPRIGAKRLRMFRFVAKFICRFEVKALNALRGLNGVNQLLFQNSATSFIARYVEVEPIGQSFRLTPAYFDALEDIFRSIYRRGVVDLDLIHEGDLKIDRNGNPVVMDFGNALTFRQPCSGIRRMIFDFLCREHEIYRILVKKKYFARSLTSAERKKIQKAWSLAKMERALRRFRAFPQKLMTRIYRVIMPEY